MCNTKIPKVTIVTPSYNQAAFLEETILSVLNQSYSNIEYIVVDGGSTDGSLDIIKKYEDRLTWWVSEPDNGQSDAINKGFKHATGEIYNWLNSDDILYPDSVKVAVHFMQKHPDREVVYGDRIVIDQDGKIIDTFEPLSITRTSARFFLRIPQEVTFFTAGLWHRVNGLNEDLHYVMDSDLWYRFLEETKFFHIPVFMGAYRDHVESKSVFGFGRNKNKRALEEICFLQEHYFGFWSNMRLLRKFYKYYSLVRQAYERNRKVRRLIKEETRALVAEKPDSKN
jgi:glycosyltransferase involved in cell wall biosynthesis